MVIAPANTGRDSNNKIVVIRIDHKNKGICSIFIVFARKFIMVTIKLMAPKIEDTPAMWREKIARSTEMLL